MLTAIEFGKKYDSCEEAMIWRQSLPNDTTQAEAYLLCPRGDWLIWQLQRDCVDQKEITQALERALDKIVARAIRRGVRSIRGNREPWAKKYRRWARRWLSGEDRSRVSASSSSAAVAASYAAASDAYATATAVAYAADAAAYAAADTTTAPYAAAAVARKKEQKLQARDIRSEIPVWPGKE